MFKLLRYVPTVLAVAAVSTIVAFRTGLLDFERLSEGKTPWRSKQDWSTPKNSASSHDSDSDVFDYKQYSLMESDFLGCCTVYQRLNEQMLASEGQIELTAPIVKRIGEIEKKLAQSYQRLIELPWDSRPSDAKKADGFHERRLNELAKFASQNDIVASQVLVIADLHRKRSNR